MAGAVAVHVAEGALQLPQADLHGPAGVGHVLSAEDHQGAVAGAALGVPGALHQDALAVGGLHGLVGGEDLGAGAHAVGDDADGAVLGVDLQLLVDLMVQVGDHQADGVAQGGAHELSEVALGGGRAGALLGGGGGADLLHDLVHDLADQFIHVFYLH